MDASDRQPSGTTADSDPPTDLDLKRALRSPSSVFSTPDAVVEHPGLPRARKIEILERWAYDAQQLAVAEDENMGGGERPHLRQIRLALERLREDDEKERA